MPICTMLSTQTTVSCTVTKKATKQSHTQSAIVLNCQVDLTKPANSLQIELAVDYSQGLQWLLVWTNQNHSWRLKSGKIKKNKKICSYFCIIFERHLGGRFSRRFIHQFIKIKQAHDWYELNDHVTCDLCGEELHCGYNIKVEHGVIISIIFHFHTVTIFKRHTITSFCLKANIEVKKQ